MESLLKFLHFEPFSRTSVFQKHILEPLSKDIPNQAMNLRALLHTICLRRNEKYLNLPKPLYEEIRIELKGEERLAYNGILEKCAWDIDELVSTHAKIKKYCILFAAIVKLRRLCNHGTLSADAEPDCDFCRGNDEDRLVLLSESEFCTECGRSLSSASRELESKSAGVGSETSTPPWASDPNVCQPSPRSLLSPRHAPQGFSTKLLAVVGNLVKSPLGSKRYGSQSSVRRYLPVSSLVFSYWTSTLDLLGDLLQRRNICFLRIDGRVTYKDRLRILDHFSKNLDIAVLLMSIETGSVG